jgi:hypothetical protein
LVVKWWCSTPHDQIFRNFIGFWRCHLDFKVSYFLQIKLKVIYFYIYYCLPYCFPFYWFYSIFSAKDNKCLLSIKS